jgi:hypothetical protein
MNLKNLKKRTIDEVNSLIEGSMNSEEIKKLTPQEIYLRYPQLCQGISIKNGRVVKVTLHKF